MRAATGSRAAPGPEPRSRGALRQPRSDAVPIPGVPWPHRPGPAPRRRRHRERAPGGRALSGRSAPGRAPRHHQRPPPLTRARAARDARRRRAPARQARSHLPAARAAAPGTTPLRRLRLGTAQHGSEPAAPPSRSPHRSPGSRSAGASGAPRRPPPGARRGPAAAARGRPALAAPQPAPRGPSRRAPAARSRAALCCRARLLPAAPGAANGARAALPAAPQPGRPPLPPAAAGCRRPGAPDVPRRSPPRAAPAPAPAPSPSGRRGAAQPPLTGWVPRAAAARPGGAGGGCGVPAPARGSLRLTAPCWSRSPEPWQPERERNKRYLLTWALDRDARGLGTQLKGQRTECRRSPAAPSACSPRSLGCFPLPTPTCCPGGDAMP